MDLSLAAKHYEKCLEVGYCRDVLVRVAANGIKLC